MFESWSFIIAALIVIAFLAFIWFLPTFIARSRKHKDTKLCFWINLFIGWHPVVWIPLILWSLLSEPV